MRRYLQLHWAFFRASLAADLEYRFNFFLRIATDIFWYFGQIVVFESLFRHVSHLGSWDHNQVRVFLGVLFVVDGTYMLVFSENVDQFSEKVRKGDLDLALAKPVSSQFILSCQKFSTPYISNVLLSFAWLWWAISNLPQGVSALGLSLFVLAIPCGALVFYSTRFMFATMNIFFGRAENLNYLWYQLYRMGTRPDSLFPGYLRYVILTILPYAFIASVPSRILLGEDSLFWMAMLLLAAGGAVMFSMLWWRFAIRHYGSASS